MTPQVDPALLELRKTGARITGQRGAVIKAMRELSVPSSVEAIFEATRRHRPLDLVTTYRILGHLERRRLVSRMFAPNGTRLFSLQGNPRYFAFHRETGELIELDADTARAVEKSARKIERALARLGYTELSHVIQFFVDHKAPRVMPAKLPTPQLPQFSSLKTICEAIRDGFPPSNPDSVVHHPAFAALEKRASGRRKRGKIGGQPG